MLVLAVMVHMLKYAPMGRRPRPVVSWQAAIDRAPCGDGTDGLVLAGLSESRRVGGASSW